MKHKRKKSGGGFGAAKHERLRISGFSGWQRADLAAVESTAIVQHLEALRREYPRGEVWRMPDGQFAWMTVIDGVRHALEPDEQGMIQIHAIAEIRPIG